MDYEVAMEMQRICTGESRELTKGQIAGEVIDFKSLTKGMKPEILEKCRQYYEKMVSNEESRIYDVDMLLEETEALKDEFDRFMKSHKVDNIFNRLYDDIGDFFQVPPFEGLDNIEYGVHEVCVFSILEYFTDKTLKGHNHETCRAEYRDSIAERTFEEVADKWISVYDDLQRRYQEIEGDVDDEYGMKIKLAGSCIVAVTAIRDQDAFVLDMAQSGAAERAKKIVDSREDETFKEGESVLDDNVVKLFDFIYSQIRENRKAV